LLLASDYNYIFPVAPSTRSGIAPPSYQTCMTNQKKAILCKSIA